MIKITFYLIRPADKIASDFLKKANIINEKYQNPDFKLKMSQFDEKYPRFFNKQFYLDNKIIIRSMSNKNIIATWNILFTIIGIN